MTQQDSRFTKIIPLDAEEHPLSLRSLGPHECDWIATAFNKVWLRLPQQARNELAAFWKANPKNATSGVDSPCIMSWTPGAQATSLAANHAGVSMYFDPVILKLVLEDPNGEELVATTIAHELAHSLHISRSLHIKKQVDDVEAEVDAMIVEWGFSGDVRRWIEEHFRFG